jgi:hypothetical protein
MECDACLRPLPLTVVIGDSNHGRSLPAVCDAQRWRPHTDCRYRRRQQGSQSPEHAKCASLLELYLHLIRHFKPQRLIQRPALVTRV